MMTSQSPKIIDGQNFIPQHRERIILVGFRKELAEDFNIPDRFDLRDVSKHFPARRLSLKDIL